MTTLNNYNFTLEVTQHTQTGAEIFVARLTEKVGKEIFKTVNSAVKTIGGYYSRFVSGFVFSENPSGKINIVDTTETTKEIKVKTTSKQNISLWDLTRWNEETNNVNEKLSTKEIAAEIRKQIRKQFPFCKFSVRMYSYNSISFDVVSSPFEEDSIYLKAIKDYGTELLKSYKYCTCYDPYGDYGSSYNFYGYSCDISSDYTQTEVTEEVENMMKDFDNKKVEFDKAEEERKEKEYQEYLIKQEEDNKRYQARQEEEKKEIEIINNSITVNEIEKDKQYFVIGSQFAKLNKNATLDRYKEEVENGDYNLQNVKITREIHFNNAESLKYFSNLLLNGFDFLLNSGGSYTDDNRINSMTDFYNMDEEERKTVEWSSYGVAIYFNNELQFIVDTQGYNYSCYVGLVDNTTIENKINYDQVLSNEEVEILKNKADTVTDISFDVISNNNIVKTWNNDDWKLYKDTMKESLKDYKIKLNKSIIQQIESEELKVAMYKVLTEVDGIQEQFENANIQQGQKLTIFKTSMLGGVSTSHITVEEVQNVEHAQYSDNVKLIFKQEGKRGLYQNNFYNDVLIYNGWIQFPKTLLFDMGVENGFTYTRTKFGSYDTKQYDLILEHFEDQGILPVINTHKPMFTIDNTPTEPTSAPKEEVRVENKKPMNLHLHSKKENETTNTIDILGKFDNIEIESTSKVAPEDVEFCQEQQEIYNNLVTVYKNFIEQLAPIQEQATEHGKKYGKQKTYFYAQDTAFYNSYKENDIERKIQDMKKRFVHEIVYYFQDKYNVKFDKDRHSEEFKIYTKHKDNNDIDYNLIIDEIINELGGLTFTEMADHQYTEKIKDVLKYKSIKLNKNKVTISDFIYSSSFYSYKEFDNKLEPIFTALEGALSDDNIKLLRDFKETIGSKIELKGSQVKSFKIFQNGRLDLEFNNSQQAKEFTKKYANPEKLTA